MPLNGSMIPLGFDTPLDVKSFQKIWSFQKFPKLVI